MRVSFSEYNMKEFSFKLNAKSVINIMQNSIKSNTTIEYPSYQLLMRIGQVYDNSITISDKTPSAVLVETNNHFYKLPIQEIHNQLNTFNCTSMFVLREQFTNNMRLLWKNDENKYAMGLYFVKKMTMDDLIKKISNNVSSVEEMKIRINQKIQGIDVHLRPTSFRLSLICPISQSPISTPVQSINCQHIECFDAAAFFLMNHKKPTWKCPICGVRCMLEQLRLQAYFLEILKNYTFDASDKGIEVLQDGTWKRLDKSTNIKAVPKNKNVLSSSDNEPLENIIDLTD